MTARLIAALLALALGSTASAAERSCHEELGPARAAILVDRCLEVSPATHPPCHASNPCSLIRDEIRRSCALLGDDPDAPAWCRDYLGPR